MINSQIREQNKLNSSEMEISSRSSSVKENDPIPPPPKQKRGGWRAIAYILGNETFEKVASMSIVLNLTVYLRTKFNISGIFLVNVITLWSGSGNIATLIGAFLCDIYLGGYLTILIGSILSLLGMATMTLTASFRQLRPLPCQMDSDQSDCEHPQKWQLAILFTGLGVIAIGGGFIKPCNIAFGADQFDTTTAKGRKQLASFFNFWYLSFTVGLLIALCAVVYIQTYISWAIGFGIPTGCFVLSIAVFVLGRHTFVYRKPRGSVFVDFVRVGVAAFRKRKVKLSPEDGSSYYDPPVSGSESMVAKVGLGNKFRCLEKAAIILDPSEVNDQGLPKDRWRLCSLNEVGQLKCLIGVLPVLVTGSGCFLSMDQMNTFGILQTMQMDLKIGRNFKIPPAWVHATGMVALSTWIIIYERIYIPVAKALFPTRNPRLTMKRRLQTGILVSMTSMIVGAIIEKKRRDSCLKHDTYVSPLTFAYLLPQFALSGLTEAFAAVACMELLTTQLPESMRSVSGSIFLMCMSAASYMSSLIVNIVHSITKRNGRTPWLGGRDLNKGRLDYFYYFIAVVGCLNFIYFTFFASRYVIKSDSLDKEDGQDQDSDTEIKEVGRA